jgi:hypothetical protein
MKLTKVMAYKLPFYDRIQQVDQWQLQSYRRTEDLLRCLECGESYYVMVPETSIDTDEQVLQECRPRLGACGQHPDIIQCASVWA